MFIPHYKPITSKRLRQLERNTSSERYRRWHDYVLERDGHKCQYPGCTKSTDLQVHHIKRFKNFSHLRYETFNGITLCRYHHGQVTGIEERYELTFFLITNSNEKSFKEKNNTIE